MMNDADLLEIPTELTSVEEEDAEMFETMIDSYFAWVDLVRDAQDSLRGGKRENSPQMKVRYDAMMTAVKVLLEKYHPTVVFPADKLFFQEVFPAGDGQELDTEAPLEAALTVRYFEPETTYTTDYVLAFDLPFDLQ